MSKIYNKIIENNGEAFIGELIVGLICISLIIFMIRIVFFDNL